MKITPATEASIEFNDAEREYLFEYICLSEKISSWLEPGDDLYEDLRRIVFKTKSFRCISDISHSLFDGESVESYAVINERNKLWSERKISLKRFKKYLARKGFANGKQYHFNHNKVKRS